MVMKMIKGFFAYWFTGHKLAVVPVRIRNK